MMKTIAIASAAALAIAGCASLSHWGQRDIPLAYAPADTVWVFGNLQRAPQEYQHLNTRWFESLREGMVQSLQRAQVLARTADSPETTDSARNTADSPRAEALLAVLQEQLAQPDGFARLGLDVNGLFALYEVQALPVLRIELADPQKFEAFIAQAEARAGQPFNKGQIGNQSYWYTSAPTQANDSQQPQTAASAVPRGVAAVVGRHLVLTLDPQQDSVALDALLGLHKPSQSVVQAGTLQAINQQYGYLPGGASAMVDLPRLLNLLVDDQQTPSWLAKLLAGQQGWPIDAACRQDLQGLTAKAPRLVGGATALAGERLTAHALLELEPALAKDLSTLPAPVPGLGGQRGSMVLGASLNPSAAAGLLQRYFASVQAAPYQCEFLQGINALAGDPGQIIGSLHAAASWISGFRANIADIDLSNNRFTGSLLLASPNPAGLIGMAQSLVPELAQANLVPGGPAQPIRSDAARAVAGEDQPVWAALGQTALGLAIGADAKEPLEADLQAAPPAQPPLLHFGFSGAAYNRFMGSMDEQTFIDSAQSKAERQLNYVSWPLVQSGYTLYEEIAYGDLDWLLTERGMEFIQTLDIRPTQPPQ